MIWSGIWVPFQTIDIICPLFHEFLIFYLGKWNFEQDTGMIRRKESDRTMRTKHLEKRGMIEKVLYWSGFWKN